LNVKKCVLPNGIVRRYPEYENMAELARRNNMSIQDVMTRFNKDI
jgi:uncharacterized protein (DUF111 family)